MANWNIKLGNEEYTIKQNMNNWIVNGIKHSKKECLAFSKLMVFKEYKLPIQGAEVLMVNSSWDWNVVVDGKYVKSGKPYQRLESIPNWSWIFVALNLILVFFKGLIPFACGMLGSILTLRICANQDLSILKKLIFSAAVTIIFWITTFGLSLLFSHLIENIF